MNNKRILIFTIIILNLLMAGFVSASGLYTGSPEAVNDDTVKSSGLTYALLVGVSTYKDPSYNLDGVQYDTPNMKDMLINDCGYSSSRITTLDDSQATKSAIRSALIQMSSRVGRDDTVVFYFSGHGFVYPSYGGTSYIEPYDSAKNSFNYDISSSELKEWLDGIQCRNVLVIIDACEAEGMLKGNTKELVTASQVQEGSDNNSEADRFSQNFLGQFETGNRVVQSSAEQQKALTGNQYVVLVSCRSGEGSWTNDLTGSWFTTYFVEGIGNPSSDTNSDNWVSAEEGFYYASPLTTWKHYDQHPVMYDGDPSNDLRMASYGSSSAGAINVQSIPAGASIYLDGKNSGYVTPATLSGVSAGSHTVRCSMPGYTDRSQVVTVNAGQTTSVSLILQGQAPVTGSVSVSSTPTGARIYLDGTDTGYITPRTLSGVSAGSHTVRCSMTGYTDTSQTVTVIAGRTSTVRLTLTHQAPVTGSVSVSSTPTGARIYLDGTDTGYITPRTLAGVPAGSHTVSCSMTGYTDTSQTVTVIAGRTSTVRLTLTRQAPVTGSVSVSSTPTGATVSLDGKSTGSKTPVTLTGISAGSHTVSCRMTGYTDASQTVTVSAGQTTGVVLNLPALGTTTGSIYVTSTPTRALVYLDGKYLGVYTPTTISKVSAGTHTIRLTKSGYKDITQVVAVTAGTTSPVSAVFTR